MLQGSSMQDRDESDSPGQGNGAAEAPKPLSQSHLVFAQPLEELDPSDTEQEKVRHTLRICRV